jgi:hypothetical protein
MDLRLESTEKLQAREKECNRRFNVRMGERQQENPGMTEHAAFLAALNDLPDTSLLYWKVRRELEEREVPPQPVRQR